LIGLAEANAQQRSTRRELPVGTSEKVAGDNRIRNRETMLYPCVSETAPYFTFSIAKLGALNRNAHLEVTSLNKP
jgi:hypothetical protein